MTMNTGVYIRCEDCVATSNDYQELRGFRAYAAHELEDRLVQHYGWSKEKSGHDFRSNRHFCPMCTLIRDAEKQKPERN